MVLLIALALLSLIAARNPAPYCNSTNDHTWRIFSCNHDWRMEEGTSRNCRTAK